jgi:hypothetical protein
MEALSQMCHDAEGLAAFFDAVPMKQGHRQKFLAKLRSLSLVRSKSSRSMDDGQNVSLSSVDNTDEGAPQPTARSSLSGRLRKSADDEQPVRKKQAMVASTHTEPQPEPEPEEQSQVEPEPTKVTLKQELDAKSEPQATQLERVMKAKLTIAKSQALVCLVSIALSAVIIVSPTYILGAAVGSSATPEGLRWIAFYYMWTKAAPAFAILRWVVEATFYPALKGTDMRMSPNWRRFYV